MLWLFEPHWKNITGKILPPSALCNEENPQLKNRAWKDFAVDDVCKVSGINENASSIGKSNTLPNLSIRYVLSNVFGKKKLNYYVAKWKFTNMKLL